MQIKSESSEPKYPEPESLGKVYLVGAGPGDTAYLTIQAANILSQAEILIYDALIDKQLLELAPQNCLRFDVGKRGGQPSTPQTQINQLLVESCQAGKQVVRLKAGDPFIFGRCTSEIAALKEANCEFEVIPGISSALAAPLLAGIPLTDPVLSRGFAVISAHDPDILDWEALACLETLVILMAGKNLPEVIHRLLRYGRSHSTPVAIIKRGGTLEQQVWVGSITNILEHTAGISISPATIVIGEVVRLREFLQTKNTCLQKTENIISSREKNMISSSINRHPHSISTQLPLAGKNILVTRSIGQSNRFCELLSQAGANPIEMPALEIGPPSTWQELDNAIASLQSFDWLILTSTNGVEYFFERLFAQGKDARLLSGVKIAVVGEKTAKSLQQRGITPDFIPNNFVADSLVENFPEDLSGKKILFPRVESGGRDILVREFTDKNAEVIEVAAYQSCCPQSIPISAELALQSGEIDIITFASSKTVHFFCELAAQIFGETNLHNPINLHPWLEDICIASIGPQTSEACRSLIGHVEIEADEYTIDGLAQAIIKWAEG